jgi:hypothetical protein
MCRAADQAIGTDQLTRLVGSHRIEGQVNAVNVGRQRNINPFVDEERRAMTRAYSAQGNGQLIKRSRIQILLAQLNRDRTTRRDFIRGDERSFASSNQVAIPNELAIGNDVEPKPNTHRFLA